MSSQLGYRANLMRIDDQRRQAAARHPRVGPVAGRRPRSAISSTPGATRLLVLSIVARLPLTAFSIALLVHTQHLTGSFAAAGVVTGAYAVSLGVGGPLLGQLVDRRGQTAVLLASAGAAAALLTALAMLPADAPLALISALAIGAGLATPPLGACLRTLLPALLTERDAVRAAYAVDASASELTWICGPPLALGLGALWSTGAALAVSGAVLLVTTALFAAQPASRTWRSPAATTRPRGGSLGTPPMRTLVLVLIAVGVLFGAAEVAVTAAAETLGSKSIAAPLLALWGGGSLAGGLLASRLGSATQDHAGLIRVLIALTAGHLTLTVAAHDPYLLGGALFLAGAAIAPTDAKLYAIVERLAPAATLTEAFAWLGTAVAIGSAVGASAAGVIAGAGGPVAAFALAGGAGALAVVITIARSDTLGAQPRSSRSLARPACAPV
jgi:MFS family permease